MTPLYDLAGRTLWVNCRVPWESVVEGLMRMQNASQWRRPITVYLGIETDPSRFLDELHAIQLYSLIRTLRSPVHTVGIGVLLGAEPLVLAAGCRGHRYLLEHSLVCCGGEAAVSDLPLLNGPPGLVPSHRGPTLRSQLQYHIECQRNDLLRQFGLSAQLWQSSRMLAAGEAIQAGFADRIVPARKTQIKSREATRQNNPTIHHHEQPEFGYH